jgi:protein-S-isoprenylcysteine O-methyltransferase Ste14
MLLIFGIGIHRLSHKVHRQAHQEKKNINTLVTTGIYSKIRHPGYVAYIISYLGTLLFFGFLSMLIPIIIFSYIFYDSAIKEIEDSLRRVLQSLNPAAKSAALETYQILKPLVGKPLEGQ